MLLPDQRRPVRRPHWMALLSLPCSHFLPMMQKLYLKEGLGAYGEVNLCLMICLHEFKRQGHPSVLGSTFCRRYASSKTASVLVFSLKLYILVNALFIIVTLPKQTKPHF